MVEWAEGEAAGRAPVSPGASSAAGPRLALARRGGCGLALALSLLVFAAQSLGDRLSRQFAAERVWVAWAWDMCVDPYGTSKHRISPELPWRPWETCREHERCLRSTGEDPVDPGDDMHLANDARLASRAAWLLVGFPSWTLALSAAWFGAFVAAVARRGQPARDLGRGLLLASVPAALFWRWGYQLGQVADATWDVHLPLPGVQPATSAALLAAVSALGLVLALWWHLGGEDR
jgi:hypothetical protein